MTFVPEHSRHSFILDFTRLIEEIRCIQKEKNRIGHLVLYMIPIFTTLIWIHIRQHGTEMDSFSALSRAIGK